MFLDSNTVVIIMLLYECCVNIMQTFTLKFKTYFIKHSVS